jgi:hypothetical protein
MSPHEERRSCWPRAKYGAGLGRAIWAARRRRHPESLNNRTGPTTEELAGVRLGGHPLLHKSCSHSLRACRRRRAIKRYGPMLSVMPSSFDSARRQIVIGVWRARSSRKSDPKLQKMESDENPSHATSKFLTPNALNEQSFGLGFRFRGLTRGT